MDIDICGIMQTKYLARAYYFIVIFIDDGTRYTWVYFIRNKSGVFEYFKEFKNLVEKKTRRYIKILQSDQRWKIHIRGILQILQNQ